MKRTKLLIAVLLILAASLILTGCPREPEEEIDPAADAGTWNTVSMSYPMSKDSANEQYFSTSSDQSSVSFNFTAEDIATFVAHNVDAEWSSTSWMCYMCNAPYNLNCIGIDVTLTKESGSPDIPYGIGFNYDNTGSYYEMMISQYYFRLVYYQKINNSYNKYLIENRQSASLPIKQDGLANNIKIATKNNGDIQIFINGTWVYTLTNPDSTSGRVRMAGGVGNDDIQTGVDPVKITYKFDKFQQQQ